MAAINDKNKIDLSLHFTSPRMASFSILLVYCMCILLIVVCTICLITIDTNFQRSVKRLISLMFCQAKPTKSETDGKHDSSLEVSDISEVDGPTYSCSSCLKSILTCKCLTITKDGTKIKIKSALPMSSIYKRPRIKKDVLKGQSTEDIYVTENYRQKGDIFRVRLEFLSDLAAYMNMRALKHLTRESVLSRSSNDKPITNEDALYASESDAAFYGN
ncbi:unnamed protein product [Trichobilharzia szidati]|nr:unnamed protein product [Trichobilharzia szidati]